MKSLEPMKEILCNEEMRLNLEDYSIPELLEIADQAARDAAMTVQILTEEINLRLMEEAE